MVIDELVYSAWYSWETSEYWQLLGTDWALTRGESDILKKGKPWVTSDNGCACIEQVVFSKLAIFVLGILLAEKNERWLFIHLVYSHQRSISQSQKVCNFKENICNYKNFFFNFYFTKSTASKFQFTISNLLTFLFVSNVCNSNNFCDC